MNILRLHLQVNGILRSWITITYSGKVRLGSRSVVKRERQLSNLDSSVQLLDSNLVALDRARFDVGLFDDSLDGHERLGLPVSGYHLNN